MRYPNIFEEKKLWQQGYNVVVGLDEAGRGPLAGPVVAAAVVINLKFEIRNLKSILNDKNLKLIRDSKQLSAKKREELYDVITNHPQIKWGVGIVSEKIIDKINILQASKLAMKKALRQAQGKLPKLGADFLLIDGNFFINSGLPEKFVIKGDQKVFSISVASIIAKVTRDRIMQKYHKKYPEYGFDRHKGYGTFLHVKNIKKFGPCKIHRKTFYPVNLKFTIRNLKSI